jgi:hypothetical protein
MVAYLNFEVAAFHSQKQTHPSPPVEARYRVLPRTNELNCTDVIIPLCPVKTAIGAVVLKHQILINLSQLPDAKIVFS